MRRVKRWRYYCDHCAKGGCSGGHIAKHERGCTRNPQRICGLCKAAKAKQHPTPQLLDALLRGGVAAVLALAGGCPACVVAAIHAFRVTNPLPKHADGEGEYFAFDYTAAAKNFWEVTNARADAYF